MSTKPADATPSVERTRHNQILNILGNNGEVLASLWRLLGEGLYEVARCDSGEYWSSMDGGVVVADSVDGLIACPSESGWR